MRLIRWLPLLLGAALASWAWLGPRTASAGAVGAPAHERRPHDLAAFRTALERWRGGDAGALAELEDLAARLARDGRPDVRGVLDHYRARSPGDLRAGLALEDRFEHLWGRVDDARAEAFTEEEWRAERADVLYDLDTLIAEARGAADGVPLARCLSLRARVVAERALEDGKLPQDARADLLGAAEADAAEADALLERAGFVTPRLEPLWIRARVASHLAEHARADELFARCLELARTVANGDFERHALEGLLGQARTVGDSQGARALLCELAALADPAAEPTLVGVHAELLVADDDAERAVEWLQRHAPADEPLRWDWRLRLANALLRAGRLEEARAALAEPARPDARGPAADSVELVLARAIVDLRRGEPRRALAAADEVRTRDDVQPDAVENALWIAGEALLRLGRRPEAIERLQAALARAGFDQGRLSESGSERVAVNVLGERTGLHAVALLAEALVIEGRALDAAAAIERHQGHQLRRARAGTSTTAALTEADVAAWAASTEGGLVTWVVGADASVVVAVAADGAAVGAPIARGRRSIEQAARRLREAILDGDEPRADELAAEIEAVLVPASVRGVLEGARGRVLCLAHGPIERLALERLPLFAAGERVPLCLPSLPEPRPPPAGSWSAPASWSVCGAPLDAAGTELLPGARKELEAVARLRTESTQALGADFDRARLLAAIASGRALHLATHLLPEACGPAGRMAPVGLELSNGDVLCARDVAALRPALPLCFLSACETGGGAFVDAQGLHGVARAFLEGGTRDLVVTLWPVEDRAARDFALAWHRALASGLRPSECAARARAELRTLGHASSEWAAFRALGRD